MPPRTLPSAATLQEAVLRVITNQDGRPASRFVAATLNSAAPDLVSIISRMIRDAKALEFRETEVREFPNLLTIEDYVARYGSEWGFEEGTIEMARARALRYDQIATFPRYS